MDEPFIFEVYFDCKEGTTLAPPYTKEGICLLAGEDFEAGDVAVLRENDTAYRLRSD
jgi:hypothetical protein